MAFIFLVKLLLLFSFVASRPFIKEDGLWTGNDWHNSTIGIGVSNGIAYGSKDGLNAKIK